MAITASRLRAVVSAETTQATSDMKKFGKTVDQTASSSSKALGGLSSLVRGDLSGAFGMLAGGAAIVGIGTAAIGIGKLAVAMNDQREQADAVRKSLDAYAGSSEKAEASVKALLVATEGGVSKLNAAAGASKLLGMGLADTSEEVGQLTRMSVILGDKTLSVQQRMDSFNAMLANQSIERLDTFNISSGKVRQRIEEMQAALPGLSREMAFTNAVLEIGGQKLAAVEAEGVSAATSLEKLGAALADLKQAAADEVNIKIAVNTVTQGIENLTNKMSDEYAAEQQYAQAFEEYRMAVERTSAAQEQLSGWYAKINPLARANYEGKLEDAKATEAAALANYELATMLYQLEMGTYQAGEAETDYAVRLAASRDAAYETAAAEDTLRQSRGYMGLDVASAMQGVRNREAAQQEHDPSRTWAAGGSGDFYMAQTNAKIAADKQYAADLARQREDRKRADTSAYKTVSKQAANDWEDAMTEAGRAWKSKMQEGMNFSIGLSDLRPGGGQGPNAPGANGAFEDIYRLQAFIQDGSWGETASKYGLDKGGASEMVKKFQSGMWDASVMQLIDKTKLTEQIQQAQLGQTMMDAVAADLAKTAGGDPKLIKAMLGMGGGTDGAAATIDLKEFIPGFLTSIDGEIATKDSDLKERGAKLWDAMGAGFIAKAKNSTAFIEAVDAMVESSLAKYIPTS